MCFDAASGGYQWVFANQRNIVLTVDLRLDGRPAGIVTLPEYDHGEPIVTNASPGLMQAFVNGALVAEAPSSSEPCSDSPPTVAPAQLPGTGGGPGVPMTLGLVCVAAGMAVLATRRQRDHRTPVRD
jgi:hypothetical protein